MKTGSVSKLCNVSKDTIHYYISLGLLNPAKQNSQYIFSDREIEDLQKIQKLKNMQFSLKDIEAIIRLGRTSNWVEPSTIREYTLILKTKRDQLVEEQSKLVKSIDMIDGELNTLSRRKIFKHSDSGIPLRALSYLACPRCHKQLQVEQASFSHKYVHSGILTCPCGYSAAIEDGVVITSNRYTNVYDKPDLERELYRTLCSGLLKMYQNCSAYIAGKLIDIPLTDKVIMEGNINGYFFLYSHFADLPRDCLYIIIDKFPETVLMYKKLIEKLNLDFDILYIADASADYPLMPGCVDICIDFFGSNEYQFYHEEDYIQAVAPFLADKSTVIGSYMDLDKHAESRKLVAKKYPESSSRCYSFGGITSELERQGFGYDYTLAGSLSKTQNKFSFACHIDNEEMRFYRFTATRPASIP